MRSKLIATLMVAAFLVMPAQIAFAQGTMGNWKAVQAIPVNERVIVKQKDGKTIEGQMIEASETNLTISRSSKVVNISRDQIRQVEHSTGKAEKGKWAAIGTGVGAAAGAGRCSDRWRVPAREVPRPRLRRNPSGIPPRACRMVALERPAARHGAAARQVADRLAGQAL